MGTEWNQGRHEDAQLALEHSMCQWCNEYAWDALAEIERLQAEPVEAREVTEEKVAAATYAVASAHHPFPSGCLCGYESARKRDVTEHILSKFITVLGGGDA